MATWVAIGRRSIDLQLFVDATPASGLAAYRGMTHGVAWGDVDGDGRPDVYLSNHLNAPVLLRNLGNGRFADVTAQWFDPAELQGDKHGAVWADYDNDGRPDLLQLTGAVMGSGAEPKRLFHNEGSRLRDVATALRVDNPEGRTRMPLWLDLDGDGRLDMFQGAEARLDGRRAPFSFVQRPAYFAVADELLALRGRGAPFCVLTEITGDDRADLVCRLMGQTGAVQVFDLATRPAKSPDLLPQTAFEDLAAADFDGDGRIDLFMARKNPPGAVAFGQPASGELVAGVLIDKARVEQAAGFDFRASPPLQVQVGAARPGDTLTPQQIRIGTAARAPASLAFELGGDIGAAPAPTPGAQAGVSIGFTAPDRWQVRVTASREALAAGRPREQEVQLHIRSAKPISELTAVGEQRPEEAPARLFMNRGERLVEEGDARGVNRRLLAGMSVVAADFDNDMCVDLFVLGSGDLGMQPSQLLLGDCRGHFRAVKDAGGAAGPWPGVGDVVTTADVDGDGFLDLLIAHGGSMGRSLGLPADSGGYRLLRNVGAASPRPNRWLQIDLEGTQSNRDGIGAIVRVSTGGVTQMRVQDGGVHHRGQNHARLHFGLAQHDMVDLLTIHWPSGKVQELRAVKAGQVLRVLEPTP